MADTTEESLRKVGDNLRRLMATFGLTTKQLAEKSGLDKRTIRGILEGTNRPQLRTIGRLAQGLSVATDEFFVDPAQLLYRHFDRQTNPVVEEAIEGHPDVFTGWTTADFDELHSRVGTGGPLTVEGALTAARQMNHKRELQEKLAVLLESSQAEVITGILELLYQKVIQEED